MQRWLPRLQCRNIEATEESEDSLVSALDNVIVSSDEIVGFENIDIA